MKERSTGEELDVVRETELGHLGMFSIDQRKQPAPSPDTTTHTHTLTH